MTDLGAFGPAPSRARPFAPARASRPRRALRRVGALAAVATVVVAALSMAFAGPVSAAPMTITPNPDTGFAGGSAQVAVRTTSRADCDVASSLQAGVFWDGSTTAATTVILTWDDGAGVCLGAGSVWVPIDAAPGPHAITTCVLAAPPASDCVAGTLSAAATYRVLPPLTLSATHGRVADAVTATFGIWGCDFGGVVGAEFFWDGVEWGTATWTGRGPCFAILSAAPPAGAAPGLHAVSACVAILSATGDACNQPVTAPVDYTVDREPRPTPSPTPKPTPAPTPPPPATEPPYPTFLATPTPVPSAPPTATPAPTSAPSPSGSATPGPATPGPATPGPGPSAGPSATPAPGGPSTPAPTVPAGPGIPGSSPPAASSPAVPSPGGPGGPGGPGPTPVPTGAGGSPGPSASPDATPPPGPPTAAPTTPAEPSASEIAEAAPSSAPAAGGVLGVIGAGDPGGPGGGPTGDVYLSALAASVPGPAGLDLDPNVLLTNLGLTVLFVLLFALTAEIFNSTIDAHRDEIHAWWQRLVDGPLRFLSPIAVADARLGSMADGSRAGSLLQVAVVLLVMGLIYSLLSTDFGLDERSLLLVAAIVVACGFLTYLVEGGSSLLARRWYGARSSVRLYGTAILVALACVFISRLGAMSPGIVYGFVASSVVIAPVALAKRDEAMLVVVPAIALMVVSLVAYALLGAASGSATSGSWQGSFLQTVLAIVFIAGLEGLVFTMLPLRFMDGSVVMRWSRVAWALLFGAGVFLWWQLLLNRDRAYLDSFRQSNVQLVAVALLFFMATTGVVWGYFRFRPTDHGHDEGAGLQKA